MRSDANCYETRGKKIAHVPTVEEAAAKAARPVLCEFRISCSRGVSCHFQSTDAIVGRQHNLVSCGRDQHHSCRPDPHLAAQPLQYGHNFDPLVPEFLGAQLA